MTRIKTSIEKIAYDIGFDIGASDDINQSKLLNGFFEALHDTIIDPHYREKQISYIVNKLSNKTRKTIYELFDNLKHADSE